MNDGANVGFFDGHAKWVSNSYILGQAADPANSLLLTGGL